MDLQTKRNSNIQRNKDLLKKLNLENLNASITNEVGPKKASSALKVNRVSKTNSISRPTRRSKRLTRSAEDIEEEKAKAAVMEEELKKQEKLNNLRSSKLNGNFAFPDLLCNEKSGQLFFENAIFGLNLDVKEEDVSLSDQKKKDLESLKHLGTNLNHENFMHNKEALSSQDTVAEFTSLKTRVLDSKTSTKLTPNRITSLCFHSMTCDKLIFAGDTSGCLGIWTVQPELAETSPVQIQMKPHGRAITCITEVPDSDSSIITTSYDGSCRTIDLIKQCVVENFSLEDAESEDLGISDSSVLTKHLIHVVTPTGLFCQRDLRQPKTKFNYSNMIRLHDKKIGGLTFNPLQTTSIATASLDRSMKIWDLRKLSKQSSLSSYEERLASPLSIATYNSRLSISTVDWNINQNIVCNGYDNQICLFDAKKLPSKTKQSLNKINHIYHNCQTGRWVTILKAKWQKTPLDGIQKFAIGNMNRSIDIYNEKGEQLANLSNHDLVTSVPAVVSFHPTKNFIIGGTSTGKVYMYS